MKIKEWQKRIYDWKKDKTKQRSLEYHLLKLHSEVTEVFEELRKDVNKYKTVDNKNITYAYSNGGRNAKPEGFMPELAQVALECCFIAEHLGLDLEEWMEEVMSYNEKRRG